EFSHYHHSAGGNGWAAVRNLHGVGLSNGHIRVWDVQRFGRDLRENSVRALAKLRARDQNANTAIGTAFHAYNRVEVALAGAGKSSAVEEGRDAHSSFSCRRSILAREALPLRVILREGERPVEQFSKIDGFAHDLFSSRCFSRLEEIPAAYFDRRKADSAGDSIHVAFHSKQTLRCAKAAKCPVRRGVGRDRFSAYSKVWPVVGACGMNHPAGKHHGRQSCVGSAIDGEVDLSAENFAVAADRSAVTGARRMTLGGRSHILGPVVDDLHRLA